MENDLVRNIWMLSREYGELAGAGGVKDVVQQLAESLAADTALQVRVVLPRYGFMQPREHGFSLLTDPLNENRPLEFDIDMDYGLEERRESCRVWTAVVSGVPVYLIDAERFSEKGGVYTYSDEEALTADWKQPGMGHYDYFAMNVMLQKSALELMVILDEKPDVIHCHDGHTAILPGCIHECQGWRNYFRSTGCLVTIHNGGVGYHQEVADLPFARAVTGLPWRCINNNRLEGKFDPFLVAGAYGLVNTVSENYARELQESDEDFRTDWLGHTLLQRGVRLRGVTNGINPGSFDPAGKGPGELPGSYDPGDEEDDLAGKAVCKKSFLREVSAGSLGFSVKQYGRLEEHADQPLFAFIGRLSEQKGVDVLIRTVEELFARTDEGMLVVFGNGSELLETDLVRLTERPEFAGRICFLRGYDSSLAKQLYAASDFFVIPSRFEPCGLTDFIAQLFGSIPVVHHVGGLVKIIDGTTGIGYLENDGGSLTEAMQRALNLYGDRGGVRKIQLKAVENIRNSYTWDVVKQEYLKLYDKAKQARTEERR